MTAQSAETRGRGVLVTGAAGFIGSHLCERLVRDGHTVRALCRYTSRREVGNLLQLDRGVSEQIDLRFGDLRDDDFMHRVMAGCETVFHLGASISVPYSFEAPREVVSTNVEGTLNVLIAARDVAPGSVVHVSSSEVYGTAQYTPIDEQHPLQVQSPYAASKVGADSLCESFARAFQLPVVIARPFNTFGPRQSLRAVIPTIVEQAIASDEIELGDTRPTRDFVYVSDTVDALIRLASIADSRHSEAFNVATGADVSVAELVSLVGELLERELVVRHSEERLRPGASEVFRLQGDAGRIKEAVGWEPQVALRDGVRAVIDWMSERGPTATPWAYVT